MIEPGAKTQRESRGAHSSRGDATPSPKTHDPRTSLSVRALMHSHARRGEWWGVAATRTRSRLPPPLFELGVREIGRRGDTVTHTLERKDNGSLPRCRCGEGGHRGACAQLAAARSSLAAAAVVEVRGYDRG